MKRLIAIILMVLFAAHTSGIEITHHLCGKVFQYISLNGHKKDTKCCCKGSGVDKGCCKTTYFKVKIDKDKSLVKSYSPEKHIDIEVLLPEPTAVIYNAPTVWVSVSSDEYIHQKVRWRPDDIYLLYCVFRI